MTAESIFKGLKKTIDLIIELESVINHATEDDTINRIIHPFIADVLGYDLRRDIKTKFKVGHRTNRSERKEVDLALTMGLNEKHHIVFEIKRYACSEFDLEKGYGQLREYVSLEKVSFGILTNGRQVRLYTDAEEEKHMDSQPYGVFYLTKEDCYKHKEAIIDCLLPLHKREWNRKKSRDAAHYIYRANQIKKRLQNPSNELLNHVCTGFNEKTTLEMRREMYEKVISDQIHKPLQRNNEHSAATCSTSNVHDNSSTYPTLKAKKPRPRSLNDTYQQKMRSQELKQSFVTCSFTEKNKSLTFNKDACAEFLQILGAHDDKIDSINHIFIALTPDSNLNRIYFKLYLHEPQRVKTRKLHMPWKNRARIKLNSDFDPLIESDKGLINKSKVKLNLNYDESKRQYYIELMVD